MVMTVIKCKGRVMSKYRYRKAGECVPSQFQKVMLIDREQFSLQKALQFGRPLDSKEINPLFWDRYNPVLLMHKANEGIVDMRT